MIARYRAVVTRVMFVVLLFVSAASAQAAPEPQPDITKVPQAAQPSEHFDVDAATDAYMALMPASAKARSDAYFEGGYWLILWDFLIGAVIALLLRSEEHTSELQSRFDLVCRLLLEKKNNAREQCLPAAIHYLPEHTRSVKVTY